MTRNVRRVEREFPCTVLLEAPVKNQVEEWRRCELLTASYKVSNWGNVKRCKSFSGEWVEMEKKEHSKDYLYVNAVAAGKSEKSLHLIHRLVAAAFLPKPRTLTQAEITAHGNLIVNHKFPDKRCNHVENLEWTTAKLNNRHARRSMNFRRSPLSKTVFEIEVDSHEVVNSWDSIADAAEALDCSHYMIKKIIEEEREIDNGNRLAFKEDAAEMDEHFGSDSESDESSEESDSIDDESGDSDEETDSSDSDFDDLQDAQDDEVEMDEEEKEDEMDDMIVQEMDESPNSSDMQYTYEDALAMGKTIRRLLEEGEEIICIDLKDDE